MTNLRYVKSASALALLLSAISGCKARAEAPPVDRSPIVADVGGETITLRELDASISGDLYRLRAESLHQMIVLRAERLTAAKRGLSVKQLREEQVDARVPEPNEEELNASLSRAKTAGTVPPDTELSSVRRDLVSFMTLGKRREAKEEYVDQLYLDHDVRLNLDAVGRPRVPFRPEGPSAGPKDARVTIVEYTDFNSQFGAMGNQTVRQVLERYPNDVRFIFKQKPEPKDDAGAQAAEAALCAHDQKKYWEFRQALFDSPGELSRESLIRVSQNLALDAAVFGRCIEERKHQAKVEADTEEARRYGMVGTPAFAVNGTPLSGAHSFRMFRRLIEVELAPKKKTAKLPGSGAPHG